MNVREAIELRHSRRSYTNEVVTQEQVETLIWAAHRAPSAGAVRPFRIIPITDQVLKANLCVAAMNQQAINEAPLVLALVADFNKMARRYRGRRGQRYVFMEAGHMGQNIALMAVALGLGTVMIGAFHDSQVKFHLGLTDEYPLYLIPVGHPA